MKILTCILLVLHVNALWAQEAVRKTVFIIADGISRDVIQKVSTPYLDEIADQGRFLPAYVGGDADGYSVTPTISAVGYNSLITGTWANKHNVWGNSIVDPNYHYWTLFRLLKHNNPSLTAAVYSTWLDNRTKLIGEGLQANNGLLLDDYYDGLELDTVHYPHSDPTYIQQIDEKVAREAANKIRKNGHDLTWVYLQYTDDMGHAFGDSPEFIESIKVMDRQIGLIWQSVKQRMKDYNEDWLIVVTTDHGRDAKTGKDHGGQSERERSTWVVTNYKNINSYGHQQVLGVVDIYPSIARFMNLTIPKAVKMEVDGVPFIGPVEASHLKVDKSKTELLLTWKSYGDAGKGKVWLSTENKYKEGKPDLYLLADEVNLNDEQVAIPIDEIPSSFYKVVLETDHQYLNYWVQP
ncbi:alkaline phosphatase family protein [Membranihabitans marinus]|uniref:alkaline phosphatase family protein n=1 Tax=Membranihabitans marinus TaxID=1227546 RepID=UPI001F1AE346|nr:alkaline phosphatase family protein [Membranihabitans marinus]